MLTPIVRAMGNGLDRLTERERECLREWLRHKTAKEIALDLGISHHAVEKRLKMARTKLGVSTSLEAARLLAADEGYQPTVAHPPEVGSDQQPVEKRRSFRLVTGVIVMMVLVPAGMFLALLGTGGDVARPTTAASALAPQQGTFDERLNPDRQMVEASPAEIASITQTTFHKIDADHSGFLEGSETPISASGQPQPVYRRDEHGNIVATGEMIVLAPEQQFERFYREADRDGDGRVSYPEYHRWAAPRLAETGIPAGWKSELEEWLSPDG